MPYQVQQIIGDRGRPISVSRDDPVARALSLMIEHDFSQLPVVRKESELDLPEGMITYEGILRGIRNFNARIADLKVRDVMDGAPVYTIEDDLFDILDRLKDTNAVLVVHNYAPDLVGIVTSYDTTEYFRNRTEDLMRVEDLELMIKDLIKAAYTEPAGEVDQVRLDAAAARITGGRNPIEGEKPKTFADLSLGDYINLLILTDTWPYFEPILQVQRTFVRDLLHGVREVRNSLAHFRSDVTPEKRDQLKFARDWLTRRVEEYQSRLEAEQLEKTRQAFIDSGIVTETGALVQPPANRPPADASGDSRGRLAALADWLQARPGDVEQLPLTFNEIEALIGSDLPASARRHRSWWANDAEGHSQAQHWLEAGWRTAQINLTEGRVTFARIREREQAYINFYTKLLDALREKADFPVRSTAVGGASWLNVQAVPQQGPYTGWFNFAFGRDRRLRVELYLDLFDQAATKLVFDRLMSQKGPIEAKAGPLSWERLDRKQASRVAVYHEGTIVDEKRHPALRQWAVETMVRFYHALAEPAEATILEAKEA